jgi:hypothetical protein
MTHQAISIFAVFALVAGCAGPSTSVGDSGSSEDGSALPATLEFSGRWHGSYGNLPIGNSYGDDADCTLQIKEDRTFTATCGRSNLGANNLERPSTWSGRVVTKRNGVVLEDKDGLWPWIMLRHSRNDILYGTTLDPLVGATVEMEFEQGPQSTAAK